VEQRGQPVRLVALRQPALERGHERRRATGGSIRRMELGYREFLGAGADTAKAIKDAVARKGWHPSERMFYPLAVAIVTAAIGGMMTYLLTGDWPSSYMDYMHRAHRPEGRSGTRHSIKLPTYWKDLEHWRRARSARLQASCTH